MYNPPPAWSKIRHRELEEAIVADPESPDAYLVYGDWLQEQGEPLGELVSVQAALGVMRAEGRADDGVKELEAREAELLAEHARGWLGYFAKYPHAWRFGFLERLSVTEPTREDYVELQDLVAARFMRELELELLGHRRVENCDLISAIVECGTTPILRKLVLAPRTGVDPRAVHIGNLRAMWPRLAAIRELTISAGVLGFGEIVLPSLESIEVTTSATVESLMELGKAKLGRLRSFSFTSAQPYGIENEWLTALIDALATNNESISRFALREHWNGNAVLDHLLDSAEAGRFLGRLEALDLSRAGITDDGAKRILGAAAKFQRLMTFDLSANSFSEPICADLKSKFPLMLLAEQNTRYRYDGYGYDENGEEEESIDSGAGIT